MSMLKRLENWYLSNCNGDWEHSFGITIDTLDNPGWDVKIDLFETNLEQKHFEPIKLNRNQNDWVVCKVKNKIFIGVGGPKNLEEIIKVFCEWASI